MSHLSTVDKAPKPECVLCGRTIDHDMHAKYGAPGYHDFWAPTLGNRLRALARHFIDETKDLILEAAGTVDSRLRYEAIPVVSTREDGSAALSLMLKADGEHVGGPQVILSGYAEDVQAYADGKITMEDIKFRWASTTEYIERMSSKLREVDEGATANLLGHDVILIDCMPGREEAVQASATRFIKDTTMRTFRDKQLKIKWAGQ